jgi:hypothetical protein
MLFSIVVVSSRRGGLKACDPSTARINDVFPLFKAEQTGRADNLPMHVPRGVSQKYFLHMIVVSGQAMRKAQARISAEIMKRAGIAPRPVLGA